MNRYKNSEKTRQALINAAGELAAEQGIATVTTRAIAERANENLGSIHYHFGGKEKLYAAVIHLIAERWQTHSLKKIGISIENPTRQDLAEMVKMIVRRNIALIFDPELPVWHCRVVYQLMQRTSPLLEAFRDAVMTPEIDQALELMKMIDPTFDDEMAVLHYFMMITPLQFHADYRDAILSRLSVDDFDRNYVRKLEDLCIRQNLLLLNLPLD